MIGMMFLWALLFLVVIFVAGVFLAGGADSLWRVLPRMRLENFSLPSERHSDASAEEDLSAGGSLPQGRCPSCNKPFQASWRACPYCGQPLV